VQKLNSDIETQRGEVLLPFGVRVRARKALL
jgi:hypothetical protein